MATEVYGCSDDLIEFEGDVVGEVGCYGTHHRDKGVLLVFSDGTLLEVKYGKSTCGGVWAITVHKKGDLLKRVDWCDDPGAERYSDTAHFSDGLTWCISCGEDWERVS